VNQHLLSILFCAFGLFGGPLAHAQLFDLGLRASGPPCDTSLVVDFTVVDNGTMSYTYTADIDTGTVTITSTVWSYFNIGLANSVFPSFTEQYFVPGQYPVCLTVEALDQQLQACSTTACKLVTIYADSICATLVPDFTISSVQGNDVTFEELSAFAGPIDTYDWTFGDGSVPESGETPTHTFGGNGPYEVCLTVTAAPPDSVCAATKCKWLYLGPGSVPCNTLLQAGFFFALIDNTVGVLDTSITSGMNYAISWDFGDGSTGSGQVAYHTYLDGGYYDVCETVTLWGPVAADTCTATVCTPVFVALTGIAEGARGSSIRAWPMPFTEVLSVDGMPSGTSALVLLDALGRTAGSFPVRGGGAMTLDTRGLATGPYVLRAIGGDRESSIRIVKR
jgi:PKD repeat protein